MESRINPTSLKLSVCLELVKNSSLKDIVKYLDSDDVDSIFKSACLRNSNFWKKLIERDYPLLLEERMDVTDYKSFVLGLVNGDLYKYVFVRRDVQLASDLILDNNPDINLEELVIHTDDQLIETYIIGLPLSKNSVVFVVEYTYPSPGEYETFVFSGPIEELHKIREKLYTFLSVMTHRDIQLTNSDNLGIMSLSEDRYIQISKDTTYEQILKLFINYSLEDVNPQQISVFGDVWGLIDIWVSMLIY